MQIKRSIWIEMWELYTVQIKADQQGLHGVSSIVGWYMYVFDKILDGMYSTISGLNKPDSSPGY